MMDIRSSDSLDHIPAAAVSVTDGHVVNSAGVVWPPFRRNTQSKTRVWLFSLVSGCSFGQLTSQHGSYLCYGGFYLKYVMKDNVNIEGQVTEDTLDLHLQGERVMSCGKCPSWSHLGPGTFSP